MKLGPRGAQDCRECRATPKHDKGRLTITYYQLELIFAILGVPLYAQHCQKRKKKRKEREKIAGEKNRDAFCTMSPNNSS